jgi:Uma2 family endonuclease
MSATLTPFKKHGLTPEEYLAGERVSDVRHEYVDGEVYAMVGASRRHGLIVNAIAFALTPAARQQHCQLFVADMKLRLCIKDQQIFYYPDLLLTCDPDDREAYFTSSPCLIIEVLSETTERIDRREKWLAYQTLPSMREYVLVAQDARRVEIFRRTRDWQAEYHETGAVPLACLGIHLALDDIYADVANLGGFTAAETL